MKYLIFLLPIAATAGPALLGEDDKCKVYTGILPDIEIDQCYYAVQSGAATVKTGKHFYFEDLEYLGLDLNQEHYYHVDSESETDKNCTFTDASGKEHTTANWDLQLRLEPHPFNIVPGRRKESMVSAAINCHREIEEEEHVGPYINLTNGGCRAFITGYGPDIEGTFCSPRVNSDGVYEAEFGTFIFHKYMHTDDLVPALMQEEILDINTKHERFPGVKCLVVNEDGTEAEYDTWRHRRPRT